MHAGCQAVAVVLAGIGILLDIVVGGKPTSIVLHVGDHGFRLFV